MDCPKCTGSLDVKYHEGIEIDLCNKCSGIWLDLGEISQIIETEEKKFLKS
jgi:Zn-finger nucleic acid-binding protein